MIPKLDKRTMLRNYYNDRFGAFDAHTMYYIITASGKYKSWRARIKLRDGNKCRECGSEENLTVHHIVSIKQLIGVFGLRTWHQAKECKPLWNEENGITYCKKCHKEMHRE